MVPARLALSGALLLCLAAPGASADCGVSGAQPRPDDVARARAACVTARARFAELFGDTVPAVLVMFHEQPGYRVSADGNVGLIYWPSTAAMTKRFGRGVEAERKVAAQWREVLPHEIMHALTIARFYGEGFASDPGGYGTPFPDWFEEAIGIWGEPLDSRRMRVAQARRRPELGAALRTILERPHPAATNRALLDERVGAQLPAGDDELWSFYPRAIALLTFVHETGGRAAVSELARRLIRNPRNEHALVGLAGMPADAAGVTRAWEKWVAEQPNTSSSNGAQHGIR
jgi:hypothetical protein